jgi:hypothetical protein
MPRAGTPGFYERATGVEICDYFRRCSTSSWWVGPGPLLRAVRLRRRRRREHTFRSRLTGDTSTVTVRRKLVDATFKDAWLMNRSSWQPLDQVVSTIESLSRVLQCPPDAENLDDLHRVFDLSCVRRRTACR